MTSSEDFVPNERLRRARSLKGWSQADLAEQIGTSFEIVSRWERGVTIPSPYYRERLCVVLGQSAEDLGLVRGRPDAFTRPPRLWWCLPNGSGELATPIDARGKEDGVLLEEVAMALEQAGLASHENGMSAAAMGAMPGASQPAVPTELGMPQDQATAVTSPAGPAFEP